MFAETEIKRYRRKKVVFKIIKIITGFRYKTKPELENVFYSVEIWIKKKMRGNTRKKYTQRDIFRMLVFILNHSTTFIKDFCD
jgi:hypothetical protein